MRVIKFRRELKFSYSHLVIFGKIDLIDNLVTFEQGLYQGGKLV